jgi:hypothetical protein
LPDFQCAVASAERDEPMFATASQVRRWLLVEVRGSWGHDIVPTSDLGAHVPAGWADKLKAHGVRPVAIRRDLQLDGVDVTLFYVESRRRPADPGTTWSCQVQGLADVVDATAAIGEQPIPAGPPGWERFDDDLVLVCTNGRHDSCCATFGRPLVRHLRRSARADAVWECSHIGGDRFAANLVVLPGGLYFGRVTVEGVDQLLDGIAAGRLDLGSYRGRSTLRYAAQAAEYFVRQDLGLTAIDAVTDVRRAAPDRFEVDVVDGAGVAAIVDVELERSMTPAPTPLTCTGPRGVSYPAYRLVSLTARPGT